VNVSALFDVCHDLPDVGTVFDDRAVNLVVDHGDFVPQGDIASVFTSTGSWESMNNPSAVSPALMSTVATPTLSVFS
jgi:hypothetical protein